MHAWPGLVKVFRGTLDGVSTEVHWLVSISLPLLIERRDQSHRIVTRLIESWAVDAGPIARTQAETVWGIAGLTSPISATRRRIRWFISSAGSRTSNTYTSTNAIPELLDEQLRFLAAC